MTETAASQDKTVDNLPASSKDITKSTEITFEQLLLETLNSTRDSQGAASKRRKVAGTACVLTSDSLNIERRNQSPCSTASSVYPANIESLEESVDFESEELHLHHDTVHSISTKPSKSKQVNTKKTCIEYSDTSDSDDISLHNSDTDVDPEDECLSETPETENLAVADYCLVRFPTKKSVRYFVGQIKEIQLNEEYKINFLRCKNKRHGKFIWPNVEDMSVVPLTDIEKRLPTPTDQGRGRLIFNLDFSNYNLS